MNIPVNEPDIRKEDILSVIDALLDGEISGIKGKYIEKLEKSLASYCNKLFGVSTCNGTAALHLALKALNIKPNDEVIIPALTMAATAFAVLYTGAKPILVDVDKDTWNINPKLIEEKITDRTKAIIPVHLYGNPCDMDSIFKISKNNNLWVIEDCAEALGAEWDGQPVGSFGMLSCHSFYASKMITTGEGGMVLTNYSSLTEKMKSLKNMSFGRDKRYLHRDIGYNYRLTNLQAALGLSQLKRLNSIIKKKERIHSSYVLNNKDLVFQKVYPNGKSVYWMNGVLAKDEDERNKIREFLFKKGIATGDIFESLNRLKFLKNEDDYPVAEDISNRGFLLPSGIKLDYHQLKYINKQLSEAIYGYR